MKRPRDKTIKEVIEYLNSIGLHVCGQNVDLDTGQVYPALRDFDPEEAVKYRRLYENDELRSEDDLYD